MTTDPLGGARETLEERLRQIADREDVRDDMTDDEFALVWSELPWTLGEWRELVLLLREAADALRATGAEALEPTAADLEAVPAWVQIRAGSELSELVRIVRFAPGQPTGFLHSDYDASGLLWRWALKWFTPKHSSPTGAGTQEPPA